jgi:hypothetical protein
VKKALAQLSELNAAKAEYGPHSAVRVEKLLASLRNFSPADAESLAHFHDTLLFLRAFPQSRKVVLLTEALLANTGDQVKHLRDSGAELDLFDSEEFSGVAGTAVSTTFTYEVARCLVAKFPNELSVEWGVDGQASDEQAWQMSSSLPQIIPLLADDCFVEADTPYLDWLSRAAGGRERILQWLMQRLEGSPRSILEKIAWYDALKIEIAWELGDSPATRTRARRNPREIFYHDAPLITRKQVSLNDELASRELASTRLRLRKLPVRAGEQALDFARAALTVRYRELWGTTRGDPGQVVEADVGRGVQILIWGLPPARRLPLRAYQCGITIKNGVPVNYFEAISLFEWVEVGFNTFYAFREGETAWIYSKILHVLHQLAGLTCFSAYPYQLGKDNEEAIQSGAFWFYRKLGFRPGREELLALTQREEKRIAKTPGYRTSARTLRKLASEHAFYEFGDGPRGLWDRFSTRNIGFAVERRMAKRFKGDPESMRRADVASLAKKLGIDVHMRRLSELEQSAFADFAVVLALAPELDEWSAAEKRGVAEIIRAKGGASEVDYLRRLQQHEALKRTLLRLGSGSE